ncbi:MAG: PDZ domain-containing protein [Planctomycetes bacterium]|nr:PDZ domain-containing protein [Planctomycetota bacterium]
MPRLFAATLALLPLAACAVHRPLPLPKGLLELEGVVEEEPGRRGWIGVEVAPNESDSLEDLEIRPGVRVTDVAAGSPAERAGLRLGDVLLAFDGTRVDDPGRLESLLRGIDRPRPVVLKVERGTAVLEIEAEAEARSPLGRTRTLYHVDRALVRAAFRDTVVDGAFPEIARIAAESPLRQAGAREGDLVLSFQGRDPGSAAELVRRFRLELEPGQKVELVLRRPDGEEDAVRFRAWSPGRELISSQFWPLWAWHQDSVSQRESLLIGDLILLSLFRKESVGGETEYSILSLISWKTGEALLESTMHADRGGAE